VLWLQFNPPFFSVYSLSSDRVKEASGDGHNGNVAKCKLSMKVNKSKHLLCGRAKFFKLPPYTQAGFDFTAHGFNLEV
jgi:hypothetical protein